MNCNELSYSFCSCRDLRLQLLDVFREVGLTVRVARYAEPVKIAANVALLSTTTIRELWSNSSPTFGFSERWAVTLKPSLRSLCNSASGMPVRNSQRSASA